jgi:hypothetical protein
MVQGGRGCCGSCRKIGLVVWKNLLLRKRHWLILLLEIVLPTLFIFAICSISNAVTPRPSDDGGRGRRGLDDNSNNVADSGRRFSRGRSTNVPTSIIDSVCFQFFNSLLVLLVAEVLIDN